MSLQKESLFVSLPSGDRLHLRHIWENPEGTPVLMIHGAVENGRIFYSETDKGFAPFLARNGYQVYVADLRGRGQSTPPIGPHSRFSQTDLIREDLPAFFDEIQKRHPGVPQIWISHSWGGVLALSTYARENRLHGQIESMVFFGTKRSVHVQNLEKWIKIDFFWKRFAKLLTFTYGYLPAKKWKAGSDEETRLTHSQSVAWVYPKPWIDTLDKYNYAKRIREISLPPMLFLAGAKDDSLGHPRDVQAFIQETGSTQADFRVLPQYGHVDMLTGKNAQKDHFEGVLDWIRSRRPMPPKFSAHHKTKHSKNPEA